MKNKKFKLMSGSEIILENITKEELIEVLNMLNEEECKKTKKTILCCAKEEYKIIKKPCGSKDIKRKILWK